MIQIVNKNTGDVFDLPNKQKLNIQKASPFEITEGSIVLPIKLPYTNKNLRALGFPHRIDFLKLVDYTTDVVIRNNMYSREGSLVILTVSTNQYIEVSITIDDSAFFVKAHNTTMPELFASITRDDYNVAVNGASWAVDRWVLRFNGIMCEKINDDFFVFEVLCKDYLFKDYQTYGAPREYFPINWVNCYPYQLNENEIQPPELKNRYTFKQTININGVDYDITFLPGHNITPFLRLDYVLKKIFELNGITLDTTELESNPHYLREAVLNNTADAIVTGKINYGQLVPTCTVAAFLKAVATKYGCGFKIKGNEGKVVKWDTRLTLDPTKKYTDITPYIKGNPIRKIQKPASLRLSSSITAQSLNYLFPRPLNPTRRSSRLDAGNETWSLPSGFYDESDIKTRYIVNDDDTVALIQRDLFCTKANYALIPRDLDVITDIRNVVDPVKESQFDAFSTSTKNFMRKTIMNYQEDKPNDFKNGNYDNEVIQDSEHVVLPDVNEVLITPLGFAIDDERTFPKAFIGNLRRLNSSLVGSSLTQGEETSKQCPIMFAYKRRDVIPNERYTGGRGYAVMYYGSSVSMIVDEFGTVHQQWQSFYGDIGLFKAYHQKRTEMLIKSPYELDVPLKLPTRILEELDMSEPVLLYGQPILPISIKYEVMGDKTEITEALFRTIREYLTQSEIDELKNKIKQ